MKFGWIVVWVLAGLSLGLKAQEKAPGMAPYLISPGDVLEVSVWHEEDLKKQCLVAPDGTLSFPLAGQIRAAGKSLTEIEQELRQRLEAYLSDPVVNVALINNQGNVVYVIGKVVKAGQYPLQRPVDVLQALSMAGGLTPFADEDDILILRRSADGQVYQFQFDYSDVKSGKNLEQNILLEPGDTVVVP